MIAAIKAKIALIIGGIIAVLFGFVLGFGTCYFTIKHTVQTEIAIEALQHDKKQVRDALDKNQTCGNSHEIARRGIDRFYNNLRLEAANDSQADSDNYVLPDERLHRWRDANKGPDKGFAARQHDTGTGAVTATSGREDTNAGGRSSGGGEAVPPAGGADVRIAAPDRD